MKEYKLTKKGKEQLKKLNKFYKLAGDLGIDTYLLEEYEEIPEHLQYLIDLDCEVVLNPDYYGDGIEYCKENDLIVKKR
jgi:hypothetical protein